MIAITSKNIIMQKITFTIIKFTKITQRNWNIYNFKIYLKIKFLNVNMNNYVSKEVVLL